MNAKKDSVYSLKFSTQKFLVFYLAFLYLILYFLSIINYANDGLALTSIAQRVVSDGNEFTLGYSYIAVTGKLFGYNNIQSAFNIINIFLILFFCFKFKEYKFTLMLLSSLIIHPLLHPLIGTVNRSFGAIIIIIFSFLIAANEGLKIKTIFLSLFAFIIHPFEALMDSMRALSVIIFKQKLVFVILVCLFLTLFFLALDLSQILIELVISRYELYQSSDSSLFNANKAYYIIFIIAISSLLFFIKRDDLSKFGLLSSMSILFFWGMPYIERIWLLPTLLTTMSIFSFFSIRSMAIISTFFCIIYLFVGQII